MMKHGPQWPISAIASDQLTVLCYKTCLCNGIIQSICTPGIVTWITVEDRWQTANTKCVHTRVNFISMTHTRTSTPLLIIQLSNDKKCLQESSLDSNNTTLSTLTQKMYLQWKDIRHLTAATTCQVSQQVLNKPALQMNNNSSIRL